MSKQPKSTHQPPKPAPDRPFQPRDIAGTDPKREQFEPTPAEPIPQHKRMAGD